MAMTIAPTKSNLLRARRSLRVARDGYGLLDRKRNVLLRELMATLDEAKATEREAAAAMEAAFAALRSANISLGAAVVEAASAGCVGPSHDLELRVLAKSVMGAWTPSVQPIRDEIRPGYSFHGTSAALDEAVGRFRHAAAVTARAAGLESTVVFLAQEIRRTQKRANALHNVLIPRYAEQIKFISESLEEREREEFFKVKQIKRKQEAAAAG
jgi:V/A-type H+-transporting ATPase subunit D